MSNLEYLNAKNTIIGLSNSLKNSTFFKTDKPYIRQYLNDALDAEIKELNCNGRVSEKQANLYQNWLTNLTIKLHPKN